MTIQCALLVRNTISLQLFAKFLKNLIKKCGKYLVPDDYLSLDETLYPMKTQISFKQFNPNKSAKYGMLYKSINACCYPFTFSTAVYPGKPKAEPTSYYTPGTSQTVKVPNSKLGLPHKFSGKKHNYHMKNLYFNTNKAVAA